MGFITVERIGNEIHYMIYARSYFLKKKFSGTAYENAQAIEHCKFFGRRKVEHVFAVVKGQFRFKKTRLRGQKKVDAQLHTLFALANFFRAARPSLTA